MHPTEIIVIAGTAAFLWWFISSSIRRKLQGKPAIGSDCEWWGGKGKKRVDEYHKHNKKCHCGCSKENK
ncbi:MAG: hypothetical protein MJ228_04020 [Bacilli bacterium]|nr:hypothetical protein [Bacilli bacterium]